MNYYISGEVPIPKGAEAKALHKKNFVKAKKIIVDSIKDHLIPQVSFVKKPKEMYWFLGKAIWSEEHKLKDDFEKPVEQCEECRDHTIILYKGISNQRTT